MKKSGNEYRVILQCDKQTEKRIEAIIDPLKHCFKINENQPLCNSLADSMKAL